MHVYDGTSNKVSVVYGPRHNQYHEHEAIISRAGTRGAWKRVYDEARIKFTAVADEPLVKPGRHFRLPIIRFLGFAGLCLA